MVEPLPIRSTTFIVFTKEKSEVCSDRGFLNNEAPSLITSIEYATIRGLHNENERLLMPRNSHYTYFSKYFDDDTTMNKLTKAPPKMRIPCSLYLSAMVISVHGIVARR